jgi:hypothetical protein
MDDGHRQRSMMMLTRIDTVLCHGDSIGASKSIILDDFVRAMASDQTINKFIEQQI